MSQECVCEERVEEKERTVEEDQAVVERGFPFSRGLDRRIAYLFEHGKSRFFRVNFHDPDNQNRIRRSCFVEVKGGEAKEWPARLYARRIDWND